MGLEWLDEIESELDPAPIAPDWRPEVQRLCRAVRELVEALESVRDAANAVIGPYMRGQVPRKSYFRQLGAAADLASKALERWQQGGDPIPPDRHGIPSEGS